MKKRIFQYLIGTILSINGYAQVETSVECTAGDLKTLLSEQEFQTTTHLTVSGTIDSRDFRTMKDSMPELIFIDMGQVTIEYFFGVNGSMGPAEREYEANTIPAYAFNGTIQEVILPVSVEAFASHAFYATDSLKELIIPPLVRNISEFAFGNTGLADITIPSTVDTISDYAFNYARALKSLTIENGLKYIGRAAFYYGGPMSNVVIPQSVTTLADDAFFFSQIESITFLSDSLHVGQSAFYSCRNLRSVEFNTRKAVLDHQAFYNCDSLAILNLGNGIDSIYQSTFYSCKGISSTVTIPGSCKYVGPNAFFGCESIPELILEEGVGDIEANAFYGLDSITGIAIPNGISLLGTNCFGFCENIKTVHFPNEIGAIQNVIFNQCSGITDIWVKAIPPIRLTDNQGTFWGLDTPNVNLHVPYGSRSMYDTAEVWRDFNIVEYANLNISQNQFTLSFSNATASINIETEANWRASTEANWISLPIASGGQNSAMEFEVETNLSSELRVGTILIEALSNDLQEVLSSKEITVYQIGALTATQEIHLENGWNLVSVYVIAEDMSIENILPSQITQVKNFDGFWNSTGLSSISELIPGEGYFIFSNGEQTITLEGVPAGM